MCLNVDKELPPLPSEFDTPTGARSTTLAPSSTDGQVNHMEPPHPTLVLEKFPSPVELALISSWHDATAAVCGICTIRWTVLTHSYLPAASSLSAQAITWSSPAFFPPANV
jgi:hypothetical protein